MVTVFSGIWCSMRMRRRGFTTSVLVLFAGDWHFVSCYVNAIVKRIFGDWTKSCRLTVEGYHRQIRIITKDKGIFPTDIALEKLVYLAYLNICNE